MANVEYIKNAVYASEDGFQINCFMKLSIFDEEMPFTAYKYDVEPHGVAIYNLIIAGEAGPIGPYVPPATHKNETTEVPTVI
jgi:hypothetical protein